MVRSRKTTLKSDEIEDIQKGVEQAKNRELKESMENKPIFVLQKKKMFFLFMCGLFVGMLVQHYQYQYFFIVDCSLQCPVRLFDEPIVVHKPIDSCEKANNCQTTSDVVRNHKDPVNTNGKIVDSKKSKSDAEVRPSLSDENPQTNIPYRIEMKKEEEKIFSGNGQEIPVATKKKTNVRERSEPDQEERLRLEEREMIRNTEKEAAERKRKEKADLKEETETSKKQRASVQNKSREKQVQISQLKPKKMWIPIQGSNGGHRRVPAIELKAGKEYKSSTKVWLYEEFLSNEECDRLIKVHEEHLLRFAKEKPIVCFDSINILYRYLVELEKNNLAEIISPNDFTTGTTCINQTFSRQLEKWGLKWSYSTTFYQGESKFSEIFSKLIEDATMLNQTHGGGFRITSYPNGVGYKPRTDCTPKSDEPVKQYATFLVFLNDVDPSNGGEIVFPEIGIDVKPKRGRALTWNSMNYDTSTCESESVNEAKPFLSPASNNRKYVVQRWYYNKNSSWTRKRSKEPELPQRTHNTPKVSCDQYNSCGLYDHWDSGHLVLE
jgi:prolyl 4-hydroxylase